MKMKDLTPEQKELLTRGAVIAARVAIGILVDIID